MFVLVDFDDLEWVRKSAWHLKASRGGNLYARRTVRDNGRSRHELMHRLIAGAPAGMVVDHINGDTFDNRRSNLRVCSHIENCRNRLSAKQKKGGLKGVYWNRDRGKWEASIWLNGKRKRLGMHPTAELAACAYDAAAREHFGEFARPNGR